MSTDERTARQDEAQGETTQSLTDLDSLAERALPEHVAVFEAIADELEQRLASAED